jgi:hypothetical protein
LQEPLQEKVILFPPFVDKQNTSCELLEGNNGLNNILSK